MTETETELPDILPLINGITLHHTYSLFPDGEWEVQNADGLCLAHDLVTWSDQYHEAAYFLSPEGAVERMGWIREKQARERGQLPLLEAV